jgi:hypothetical protein
LETDACFSVRDANGQALPYVCSEDEPGKGERRRNLLPQGRGATHSGENIAKLPDLLEPSTGIEK